MVAKKTDRTICMVWWCSYPIKVKGLCGTHYHDYRNSKDYKDEVNLFELERSHNPPPMSYWPYVQKVRQLARSTGVPKSVRVPFQKALTKRYSSYLGRTDD